MMTTTTRVSVTNVNVNTSSDNDDYVDSKAKKGKDETEFSKNFTHATTSKDINSLVQNKNVNMPHQGLDRAAIYKPMQPHIVTK